MSGFVQNIVDHHYFNGFCQIVGILGFVFGLYAYFTSQKAPHLSMYELPRKTIVVSTKEASDVQVLFNKMPLKEDVVATQLVIWNAGNESIRKEQILREIEVFTLKSVKIYDVRIIKNTRPIIDFSFKKSQIKKNILPISWKILEPDDGVLLQIIHSGNKDDRIFDIRGTIEKQNYLSAYKNPVELGFIKKFFSKSDPRNSDKEIKIFGWISIFLGLFTIAMYVYRLRTNVGAKMRLSTSFALILPGIVYILTGLLMLLSAPPALPL